MTACILKGLASFLTLLAIILSLSLVIGFTDLGGVWVLVTHLGSMEFYVAILPVFYHYLARRDAVSLSFSLLLAGSITGLLKDVLRLPRPPTAVSEGFGFPSGHSSGSTAFWGYLSITRASTSLSLLALALVGLISASRLVLGEHYPRDVAGGIALGLATAITSAFLSSRYGEELILKISLATGLVFLLILFATGYGALEPPSVLLGFTLAELTVGKRITLRAGPLLGVLGSLSAGVVVGLASLTEAILAEVILFATAGYLAVAVPKAIKAFLSHVRKGGST